MMPVLSKKSRKTGICVSMVTTEKRNTMPMSTTRSLTTEPTRRVKLIFSYFESTPHLSTSPTRGMAREDA